MVRFTSRRKTVRPFRAMRKARMYRSMGLRKYGAMVGKYIGRKVSNQIHSFRKQVMLSAITETGSNQHLGYQFNLDQLSDEVDFQNMYDAYKIAKIVLTLEPAYSGTNANSVAPSQNWTRIVHDYDDVTPLTAESQYLEYGGCKSRLTVSPRPISIPLYPKISQYIQTSGGSGTVLRAVKAGWLPTVHDQVDHLGLKIYVPSLGLSTGAVIYKVRATFVIKCKNTK